MKNDKGQDPSLFLEPLSKASGKVGGGYSVEITIWRYGMRAVWTPDVPRAMTGKMWERYRSIRDQAAADASLALGAPGSFVVLEL
jgi:hypothetical protein